MTLTLRRGDNKFEAFPPAACHVWQYHGIIGVRVYSAWFAATPRLLRAQVSVDMCFRHMTQTSTTMHLCEHTVSRDTLLIERKGETKEAATALIIHRPREVHCVIVQRVIVQPGEGDPGCSMTCSRVSVSDAATSNLLIGVCPQRPQASR